MAWNEPKSVEAARQYVRIIAGLLFFIVLLYLLLVDRIDIQAVMAVISGLAGLQSIGQAVISRQQTKAREAEIVQFMKDIDY